MTLAELSPGYRGTIKSIGGEGALRRRLLDMGLTPKTKVEVRKKAPMGDPIELFLRGYALTIRLEDAAKIEMTDTEQVKADVSGKEKPCR
jgi:ferrous iron transport protein A